MLSVRNAKDEVDDFGSSTLPLLYGFGRIGMRAHTIRPAASGITLSKDSRAISKRIADGRAELPKYLAQSFLEILIDLDVLVVTKMPVRQIRESRYFGEFGVILPTRW